MIHDYPDFIWYNKYNQQQIIQYKDAIKKYWLAVLWLGLISLCAYFVWFWVDKALFTYYIYTLYNIVTLLLVISICVFVLMLLSTIIMTIRRWASPDRLITVLIILLIASLITLAVIALNDALFSTGLFAGLLAAVLIVFVIPPIIGLIIILYFIKWHIKRTQRRRESKYKLKLNEDEPWYTL